MDKAVVRLTDRQLQRRIMNAKVASPELWREALRRGDNWGFCLHLSGLVEASLRQVIQDALKPTAGDEDKMIARRASLLIQSIRNVQTTMLTGRFFNPLAPPVPRLLKARSGCQAGAPKGE